MNIFKLVASNEIPHRYFHPWQKLLESWLGLPENLGWVTKVPQNSSRVNGVMSLIKEGQRRKTTTDQLAEL